MFLKIDGIYEHIVDMYPVNVCVYIRGVTVQFTQGLVNVPKDRCYI